MVFVLFAFCLPLKVFQLFSVGSAEQRSHDEPFEPHMYFSFFDCTLLWSKICFILIIWKVLVRPIDTTDTQKLVASCDCYCLQVNTPPTKTLFGFDSFGKKIFPVKNEKLLEVVKAFPRTLRSNKHFVETLTFFETILVKSFV